MCITACTSDENRTYGDSWLAEPFAEIGIALLIKVTKINVIAIGTFQIKSL